MGKGGAKLICFIHRGAKKNIDAGKPMNTCVRGQARVALRKNATHHTIGLSPVASSLHLEQLGIAAAQRDQFGMAAGFSNTPLFEHQDVVSHAHG